MSTLRTFGLIGFPLGHSFSKRYYDAKIEREDIQNIQYELFPLENVSDFLGLIKENSSLCGVNVTIPYKISVLPYLDWISEEARSIGAVNCIQIVRDTSSQAGGRYTLKGFNTDVHGFVESIKPVLQARLLAHQDRPNKHMKALILGDGGAAQAVRFGLNMLNIPSLTVSRHADPSSNDRSKIRYDEIDSVLLSDYHLIVNTTPLGTFPNEDSCPDIPYQYLGAAHVLYDLVYNPAMTLFLKKGAEQGTMIKNGYEMLELQAEKNWDIWMERL